MSGPTVLAFDTSAAHCAAALHLADGKVMTRVEQMSRGQGERLMVMLEEVLSEAGITWADLDALAVGIGPGNFTGIRISVSAARGLALGLGVPAIGISGFAALAQGHARPYTAALPAPRDQRYVQTFGIDATTAPTMEPGSAPAPDADALIRGTLSVAFDRLTAGHPIAPPAPLYVKPPDAAPARDAPPKILP